MTRINLIDPRLLSDQHLLAEWREMPRVASSLKQRLQKGPFEQQLSSYRMGAGHMTFFYDKMDFLAERYSAIVRELKARRVKITEYETNPFTGFESRYCRPYTPSSEEVNISRVRICEKLDARPNWYRYRGVVESASYFKGLISELL